MQHVRNAVGRRAARQHKQPRYFRAGHKVGQAALLDRPGLLQQVAQSVSVGSLKDLVNTGLAHIGIDQQDATIDLSQANGQIADNSGLSLAGTGTGNNQHAGTSTVPPPRTELK